MKENHKRIDVISGVVVATLGVIGFIGSYSIKVAPGVGNISATTMPRIISVILFILGLALCAQSIITSKKRIPKTVSEENEKDPPQHNTIDLLKDYLGVGAAILIFIVYILLLEDVGFVLLTPVMIFAYEMLLAPKNERTGARNIIKFVAISIVATGILYALFYLGFKIMLPMGFLR